MDDMTAFEQKLSAGFKGLMGPLEPVDDAAIFTAATATYSPKWRIQPMFSATKFVVAAAAIVALFGGFLLAAVAMQPDDESVPAVGASPSASPRTTDDLLSRLDTEEVAPGVLRVHGDGSGRSLERTTTIYTEDNGAVWLDAKGTGIEELGDGGRDLGRGGGYLVFAEDGTVWRADNDSSDDCCEGEQSLSLRSFDGKTWTQHGGTLLAPGSTPDPWWPADYIVSFAVALDGTVWHVAAEGGDDAHTQLQRLTARGWSTYDVGDELQDLGCGGDCGEGWHVVATPDGSIWVSVENGGLLRFDGTDWEAVRPLGGARDHGVKSLAVNRDGILWAEVQTTDDFEWGPSRLGRGRHLARFDGEEWEVFSAPPPADVSYDPDGDYRGPSGIRAVGPNGTVWLMDSYPDPELRPGMFPVSFDGERWRRYPEVVEHWASDPVFDLAECCTGEWHIAVAPDGTAWVNVDPGSGRKSHGGVYAIRPGAPGTADAGPAPVRTLSEESSGADEASVATAGEVMLPAEIPQDVESGTFDSPLGAARWVHLRGDDETLPSSFDAVPVAGGGFITLDFEAEPPELWRSPDLFNWNPEPAPVEARYGELTATDDAVWLTTFEPTGLWRSVEGREWSEVGLDGLTSPEPDGFAWRLQLGTPLSADGVTILPFEHSPDYTLISRSLWGPDERYWYVREQGDGVYALVNDRGDQVRATVRFEDTGAGLRVIDVEDGTELTLLDGISLEFIERLVSDEGIPAVQGLALIGEDGLVEVELPGAMSAQTSTRFMAEDSGFVSYGLGEDGLVHVHRSEDGREWVETDTIGDGPGEPTDIVGIYQHGPLVIESEPHITEWTSTDGVAWESIQPPDQFAGHRLAAGWLWIQMVGEPLPWGSAEPETTEETMWFVPLAGDPVPIDMGDLDFSGPGGDGYGSRGFISTNTLVSVSAQEEGAKRRDIWIVTFDELRS